MKPNFDGSNQMKNKKGNEAHLTYLEIYIQTHFFKV